MADTSTTTETDVDVVVVGAGFAGIYLLYRLRQSGFNVRVFEAGGDVGGTWYWNRYPGARCDIESMQYSYQFSEELQQEWTWAERYASQPEILSYIEHVVERFDLRADITFDTRVEAASFDDDIHQWTISTSAGEKVRSRFFILGSGVLSTTNTPSFKDRARYIGRTFHTGRWPHEKVDFTGQRVGIIGTGSSGIQSIPHLAAQAEHLYVFQRTPNYVVPAQNRALTDDEVNAIKSDYRGFRAKQKERPSAFLFPFNPGSVLEVSAEERFERFEAQWEIGGLPFLGAFGDLLLDKKANKLVTEYWTKKIRALVDDPGIAELLIPDGDIFGGKRLCAGTDYYETYNRDDVTLVDVRHTGIERFTPTGVQAGGADYELDAVVFATGFDALTGSVVAMDIAGPDGITIKERWREGPETYLGLAVSGFPNFFNTQGPGSPGVFVTMVTGIEHQSNWIVECLLWMRDHGYTRFEATAEAQTKWGEAVEAAAKPSLRSKCDSWYTGSNIPGKHRVFMPYIGGFPAYFEQCRHVADNHYEGITFEESAFHSAGPTRPAQ
ncbi:MAG: NAD(P)/FAD-dependent oxidoreductase [Chromatiales bacterium]|nr:NAD(P)/FAD-dependent oxidoreductase [Chromatiales bacterium]